MENTLLLFVFICDILYIMKNKKKLIVLCVVTGFVLSACFGAGSGRSADLVGKWYASQEAAGIEDDRYLVYEFTRDGKMIVVGNIEFDWEISNGTITTSMLGFPAGSAEFAINGTVLTISNMGESGLLDGTYYKAPGR